MAEETIVTVGQLVTALDNIKTWCGVIHDVLAQLNQSQEIVVSQDAHDQLLGDPPNSVGGCKPH